MPGLGVGDFDFGGSGAAVDFEFEALLMEGIANGEQCLKKFGDLVRRFVGQINAIWLINGTLLH